MPPSGTRRTTLLNRRAGQKARLQFWMRRFGLLGGVALVLGLLGYYLNSNGIFDQYAGRTARAFHAAAAQNGLAVRNLLIEGRIYTDREGLKTLLDITKGQSIFEPDLAGMKHQLEQLTWVRGATVERHFPDTLAIRLDERRPLALWQRQNKLSVIDADGVVLTERDVGRFRHLMIVVGDKAPHYAPELVAMIEAEPDLSKRVESAKWVGGRRWDLYLKNGVAVRLPEEDVGMAVRRLAKAQGEAGLMDKRVEAIDLRDPLRIVVQTSSGAVPAYQASFNPDKNI